MSARSFEIIEQRARAEDGKISLTTPQHEVLAITINAAELYMQALGLAVSKADKSRLDSKCKELLTRAENLKREKLGSPRADQAAGSSLTSRRGLKPPTSKRRLITREEIILLEGSKLNGFVFPPWKNDPAPEDFVLKKGQELFVDSPPLRLSPLQLKTFAGWKRPWEIIAEISVSEDAPKIPTQPTMQSEKRIDLVQDMTSDCSVVASLCAGSARAERGHPSILPYVIFPYDHREMQPAISPSSKYVLRLYFNGSFRRVVLDDLLPSSTDSRIFHVVDRRNPGCLWPALVEKAYLKIRGGYDFPGSNSGTDLAVLTGWLPEQVFLHDEDVIPEELWSRVFKAFAYGDVLVTIGTGNLSKQEQRYLGLAAEHDYAILDMKEIDGLQKMLIKNPWSDGDVWKGALGRLSVPEETAEDVLVDSLGRLSTEDDNEILAPGTFWMELGSIFQHFENLYLNWNPGLFSHRQDYHFLWDLSQQKPMSGSFESNPQFSVICSENGILWLLLNRHFRTGDYLDENGAAHGFISLYIFIRNGNRVLLSDGAFMRGPYVDSPNTLIRLDAKANAEYTVVAAAQDLPSTKLHFTLSAFSRCPMELSLARKRYSNSVSTKGTWTHSTAGGNSDSSAYLANPQFLLEMCSKANVAILLESIPSTLDANIAVNIKVFFTKRSRVTAIRMKDIVAHSGDYRRGSTALEISLEPGNYTIICSTFDAGQTGKFTLSIHSSADSALSLRPLYLEGSGRLTSVSQPAIFAQGTNRLLAPVNATRLTRASLVVQPFASQTAGKLSTRPFSPLKLTLEQGQGPYKTCLATSSASDEHEYTDLAAGVRIDDFDIRPELYGPWSGGLWVVLQRMAGGSAALQTEEIFQILVIAEDRVELGAWGLGDG